MLTSPFPARGDRKAADRVFGSTVTAPGQARSFVRAQLGRWGLPELVDTVELLTSELVTNAVRATAAVSSPPMASSVFPVALRMVALRLLLAPASLVIEVWDVCAQTPAAERADPPGELREGGRGLTLVGALSTAWGQRVAPDRGKIVWCEVAVPAVPSGSGGPTGPGESGGGGARGGHSPAPPVRRPGATLPRRLRHAGLAERVDGPDARTLRGVLDGLRRLD
ncbi:ATP-binding protein [Microtetraspora niveoalba]|uniref:ATP-binding protein n=1 Tax=Microtetraspora niveoalba TaxID=46175 RepID=UPI00082D5156|nr:ATP-binding protein [Microtetraspora niveoalba]